MKKLLMVVLNSAIDVLCCPVHCATYWGTGIEKLVEKG